MEKIELIIKKRDEKNEKARYNYNLRSLNGVNKQLKKEDEKMKVGRPKKDKKDIVKNRVGRPVKIITEENLKDSFKYLIKNNKRGRPKKNIEEIILI